MLEKGRGEVEAVQQLQGAAPDNKGLRFIGALRGLLNDADGDSKAMEVDGHGETDGARSYDQYVCIHGCTSPL